VKVRFGRLEVGSSVEWYTPPEIFDALGVRFGLDPCAPPGGLPWAPVERYYSARDDGLAQEWHGRVWLNPPYGRGIERWMRRLAAHANGIALVHSRTGTAWWREALASATAVCFIAGRVRFIDGRTGNRPPGASPEPLVLLAYGLECATAVMRSGLGPTLIVPPDTKPGQSIARLSRSVSGPGMADRPAEGAPALSAGRRSHLNAQEVAR
jgi:phage N-6-adenine-methyltransferase